jgi:hypothetical protein
VAGCILGRVTSSSLIAFVVSGALVASVVLLVIFGGGNHPVEHQTQFGTFQGFGTLYYGWRHRADRTATATKWVVAFWLPLLPLRRQRIRVLTDFSRDLGQPVLIQYMTQRVATQENYFQIVEELPLSFMEIAVTLAKTYLVLPLLLACPPVFIWQVIIALRRARGWESY